MKICRFRDQWGMIALAGVFTSLIAGCGSGPADLREQMAKDRLDTARSTYELAKGNTIVESYGMKQLLVAEQSLKDAENAMKKPYAPNPTMGYTQSERDVLFEDAARLAYIANRNAQSAISYAEGIAAANEKLKLSREKADVQLLKSNLEKDLLKNDINEKNGALERAKHDLRAATTEAERARILADINAKEALLAKAELEQLMKEVSDLQGKMTNRGIVLTIGDVLFATGKSYLNGSAQRSMDKIAKFMGKHPDRNLLVEGHTDSVGGDDYNQRLAEQRADSVKSAIVGLGVPPERIVTIGYGKKYPLATNGTATGRQQNRRVEVVILNEGVNPESQFRK